MMTRRKEQVIKKDMYSTKKAHCVLIYDIVTMSLVVVAVTVVVAAVLHKSQGERFGDP